MTSYQLRDTTTSQLLARDLADHAAAETVKAPAAYGCAWTSRKVTDSATEAVEHHVLLLGVDDSVGPLPSL
ncbi:hypothetical protein [Streptomyces canus]|uniref:hypothetical protein n=1 Tax=Streptomyces canus TaxID=58343 RepID=UPI002252C0D1|nr:hypothetical protein [Streptomyces canus]